VDAWLLGSKVSLGRAKWEAPVTAVAAAPGAAAASTAAAAAPPAPRASIFSVSDGKRLALIMAGLFVVYAGFVAWRGWDFVTSGQPAAIGLGLAVLILPLLAAWLVWREVQFGFRMQQLGELVEVVDERTLDERIADAQADPDDWLTWYWVGAGYFDAGDKKQARTALDYAWEAWQRTRA
jgi:hypothetical protein